MGSPTQGLEASLESPLQWQVNSSLMRRLQRTFKNELNRFVNAATNGVQFVSSRMEEAGRFHSLTP